MKKLCPACRLAWPLLRGIAAFAILSLLKAPLLVAVVGVIVVTLAVD